MKTRSLYLLAAAGGLVLFTVTAPQPTSAQDSPAETSPQLAILVNEVSAQTAQLTANQAQIDARLAEIAEDVRQARIFAARAGRKGAAPK